MIKLRSISSRLIITYLIIAVLTAVLLLAVFSLGLKGEYVSLTEEKLKNTVGGITDAYEDYHNLSMAGAKLEKRLKEVADYQDSRIWVFDKFGTKWFDVCGESCGLKNDTDKLENSLSNIKDKIENAETGYTLISSEDIMGTPIMTYTSPLKSKGENVGYVVINKIVSDYNKNFKLILKELLYCLPLILLIAFVIIFWVSHSINKPLNSINEAAKELAEGNFEKRADESGPGDIGGIIASFNYMAEELEKYEKTRESFVGNVSHELRSPLTSIQGFVQGMLDGTIEEQDRQQYLETVLSETKRMNALISDLLDLAKYESGQFPMNFKRWDINELIRRVFINFITKIEDKQLDVTVNIPDERQMVVADKDRITQVLTNLIDNAVKFCDEKGELKIWTQKEGADTVKISISNSGKVIPAEDIPYVFDRFFKVDKSHNRKSPGTGIGLSIVKTIIQQHGEKIWVSSKRGKATVFTFTLSDRPKNNRKSNDADNASKGGKYGR